MTPAAAAAQPGVLPPLMLVFPSPSQVHASAPQSVPGLHSAVHLWVLFLAVPGYGDAASVAQTLPGG